VIVLVTAVGGDIGQTLLRILRRWDAVSTVIGTDIADDTVGRFRVDQFLTVKPAGDPSYVADMLTICRKHHVDVLIPVNESEIKRLAVGTEEFPDLQRRVVSASGKHFDICFDKLETNRFLGARGIPVPWAHPADERPPEYPCVMKRRSGSGSKGFRLLNDEEERLFYVHRERGTLLQQYLGSDDEEYTCGVYRSKLTSECRVIVLRRRLMGGLSGKAVVVGNEEIKQYCIRVVEALELFGSVNLQLRMTNDGPKLFEINPRFSSTAGFRDAVGFRDVRWSIDELLGRRAESYDEAKAIGRRFYRYFDELYL